jgi:hypothetical protein
MTYDGLLVVIFSNGVAVIDRNLDPATAQFVAFGADETVTNSIAVDEENGLYVASNKFMRKLVWTGTTLSEREVDGAWISAYDAPSDAVPPLVKFGTGTGSTPTLMGFGSDPDKLVVITDGEKRMKLVAFWRDQIPEGFVQKPGTASRRIAGQIQVTCGLTPQPEWIQSEQSVVVRGYGAFVVNNIPGNVATMGPVNKILDVAVMGPIFDAPSGVERFRWDAENKEWKSVWARPDVSSTSMVPVNSRSSNMALVNGYTREDGWEVTGMDWDTGRRCTGPCSAKRTSVTARTRFSSIFRTETCFSTVSSALIGCATTSRRQLRQGAPCCRKSRNRNATGEKKPEGRQALRLFLVAPVRYIPGGAAFFTAPYAGSGERNCTALYLSHVSKSLSRSPRSLASFHK